MIHQIYLLRQGLVINYLDLVKFLKANLDLSGPTDLHQAMLLAQKGSRLQTWSKHSRGSERHVKEPSL